MDNKMHEFARNQKKYKEQAKRREGEVTINYNPNQSKNKPSKGEYIDYVEVKD
jgi:hypothetical protein